MTPNTSTTGEARKDPSSKWWQLLLFGLCSVGCMTVVFGSALWGQSLLAPLDIPAAMYSKYHWLNESQGPVPNNHYIVDIYAHELPRQYSIYRAMQSGEFPWWDPYTDCGRPLVAEGHISGTDGLRLTLYRLLPFVEAYNLTKLLHSFLLGLGVFVLLRHWGHRFWVAAGLGLAFEFASTFALFQTPLCVTASAVWYPWIWLAWSSYVQNQKAFWLGAAGIFCGLSFAAGNQQTDVFLVVFAACFLAGNFWHERRSWKPALRATLIAPLLGGLMALPVLVPQAELFLLCKRVPAFAEFSRIKLLTGAAGSLTAAFPWALGTFRTVDVSKLFNETGLGFCLFIGSTAVVLGVLGAAGLFSRRTPQGCVGVLLVLAYLLICSTPLVAVFYTRLAGLAVLGLVALAGEGARDILAGAVSIWQKRLTRLALVFVFGALLCCNFFAFVLFPHVRARLESVFLAQAQHNRSFAASPELRRDQIENLPREISVLNPETVVSVLGAGALLAAVSIGNARTRTLWLALALGLNLAPELSFAKRFTTRVPVEQWQALLRGGPEQRSVADSLKNYLRLKETWAGPFDPLFPSATANFYAVHVTHTYSSFPLPDLEALWNQEPATGPWEDVTYTSEPAGHSAGELAIAPPRPTPSRFQWRNDSERKVQIIAETFDTITVKVEDGVAGELLRTDRYYPGWKLRSPKLEMHVERGSFLAVQVPAGRQTLIFEYRPRGLDASLFVGSAALLVCVLYLMTGAVRRIPKLDPKGEIR